MATLWIDTHSGPQECELTGREKLTQQGQRYVEVFCTYYGGLRGTADYNVATDPAAFAANTITKMLGLAGAMKCFGKGRCSHPIICKVMGCAVPEARRFCPGEEICETRGCAQLDPSIFDVPAPTRDHRITCPECNGDGAWGVPGGTPHSWRKARCSFCCGRGHICDDEEDGAMMRDAIWEQFIAEGKRPLTPGDKEIDKRQVILCR